LTLMGNSDSYPRNISISSSEAVMSETSIPDTDPQTAGSLLRHAREQKGVKLEEAAKVTRIAKGYLKALEEDCYDRLPNEAYARGFLRVYAQFLGLRDDEVMGAYRRSVCSEIPDVVRDETLPVDDLTTGSSTTVRRRILLAVPVTVVFLALLFIFYVNQEKNASNGETPITPKRIADSAAGPTQPVPTGAAEDKPAITDVEQNEDVPFKAPVSQGKGVILRLKALEDGSLDVTIDSMISQHYDLKAGDLIEWKGEKGFSIDLENAGGVEAELNGKMLAPFGAKGVAAHVELRAEGEGQKTLP